MFLEESLMSQKHCGEDRSPWRQPVKPYRGTMSEITSMCVHVLVCVRQRERKRELMRVCACMCVCVCMYESLCMCVCVCVYVCVCMSMRNSQRKSNNELGATKAPGSCMRAK